MKTMNIPQRVSFITIGVKDLNNMKKFYKETFGWKEVFENEGIIFFQLNGIIFGLFPQQELAEDASVHFLQMNDHKPFSLSINMGSEQEVDKLFEKLNAKKVKIARAPEKVFWGGYRGYIEDPEHNLWEFAYNPSIQFDEKGNIKSYS